MVKMNDIERLVFLVEEVGILKTKIREYDTGHWDVSRVTDMSYMFPAGIHTAINVLEHRVKEVKEKLNNES